MLRRNKVRKKASFISVLVLVLLFKPCFSEEKDVLSFTLEDCIVKALKDNLNVAVEVYNPELADTSVTKAREFFMPRLDLNYGNQRRENPSFWWLEQADTVINEDLDYSASLIQQIPTGGNFSLSLSNSRSETNAGFQNLNPRYGSTLTLNFTQPLLRNFGFTVSKREIIVARNNLDISLSQFKKVLMDTIYSVQEAYWNLVYTIEDYKVKQQSLQLARDLLAKNKKEVEVGKLAEIEILNAETVVASREADILQAEALIRRSEDVLKNLLNISEEEVISPKKIVPLDKPEFIRREISLKEAFKKAIERSPDLKMKKKNIETSELNFSVAKNQMLPGLDLQFSYWSPGLSGDRILYGANPFDGPIGEEEGSPSDSIRDAFKFLYNNWTVGLTLSIPLSSLTTKADYARARMEMEKGQIELKSLEKQVFLEVKNAIRDIETNFKRVQAYRLARELAEKRLEAEVKKLGVGLTTNYFVLQYQEELANRSSMELLSLVDYNLALARLEKAVGESLEKRGIIISQFHTQ
ncbi:MAG: TolC family protein [Candidatus Aminicenantes bacterium]|nr:TolC family protein [Candidatus Aminicenantes bacterium]